MRTIQKPSIQSFLDQSFLGILLATLPVLSTLPALAADDPAEIIVADHCKPGDPMCVEKGAPIPKAAPPPAASSGPKKPAVDVDKQHRERNANGGDILREKMPTLRSAPVGKPLNPSQIRNTHTEEVIKNGERIISFEDDGLNAAATEGCVIKSRPKLSIELPCFDKFWAIYSDANNSEAKLKTEYAAMQQCMDPCVSKSDAAFLASCIDWTGFKAIRSETADTSYFDAVFMGDEKLPALTCSLEKIQAGLAGGAYKGSKTQNPDFDEKKGQKRACSDETVEVAKKIQTFGKKLAKDYEKNRECPKTKEDYEKLRQYAESLLALGGKVETLPILKPGTVMGKGCGYSPKHDEYFTRAVYCTDSNTCIDQMRDSYQLDCTKFTRRDSRDRFFYAQGTDCAGMESYHRAPDSQKSRGDLFLIPIGDGVWIHGYNNGMGLKGVNYVGLVFAK
jgi:hypothetical protein